MPWVRCAFGNVYFYLLSFAIHGIFEIRCDQKADCDDESDEASCQIVHISPDQYLKVR